MAILKCKMCGGNLEIQENTSVAECEFCGTKQTVPKVDDEKKINLFTRANKLRSVCEFDKAYGVFESIVSEFKGEAEAYWGLVLCKYGIEYVDDPKTGKKIPTCHRSSFESILEDENYKQTLNNADVVAKEIYKSEAEAIEKIRKGIIEISSKEEPYDIFICYKETAPNGERTKDSVLAQEIYDELTEKDYKVFFSRITLEDKLGVKYEPYIFSALHSSKVMLVIGTKPEYLEAIWVKNEWSRYLKLIASGEKKTIIPCYRNMDAYDLPSEFADLQGQDMGKVGAIQDLIRGIGKIIPKKKPEVVVQQVPVQSAQATGNASLAALVKRAYGFLGSDEISTAREYFNKILDQDPENKEALIGTVLIELKLSSLQELENGTKFFHNTKAYKNIKGVCSDISYFEGLLEKIKENNYKAIGNAFASGNFSVVDSYVDNLLTYEEANDKIALYSFLAEHKAKSIDELAGRDTLILDLANLKKLMDFVGEETKGKINKAIKTQKENVNRALEEAFASGEYGKIESIAKKALRFEEEEKPYLYTFLAAYKVKDLCQLESFTKNITKDEAYKKFMAHASAETKDKLKYTVNKQKENLEFQIVEAYEAKDFEKAYQKCELYHDFDEKNERVNLIYLFASLKISTYEEIETCETAFTDSKEYKLLIASCGAEVKKELTEATTKQAKYQKDQRIQKINSLEVEMQAALEKSDFDKAKRTASYCLALDPKNEKALVTAYLAGKGVKVIEDLAKGKTDFTKEKEYKELISKVSAENKKRFEDTLASFKAKKKKKTIITLSTILAAILVVGIVLLIIFTSDAFVYGAKDDGNGGIIITDYRGIGGDITIPEKINGKPVTAIAEYAFRECRSLESVVIPNSVTTIGSRPFIFCDSLAIYCGIEESEKPEGWGYFWEDDCFVVWGVTDFGTTGDGFKWAETTNEIVITGYKRNKANIEIPSEINGKPVTAIGGFAFLDCRSLKSVVIPNSVTTIGGWAFNRCSSLKIYCEADSKPEGWSSSWNYSNCPVVWNFSGFTEDGLTYRETENGITILGYRGNATTLEIPSEINGKPVTTIGEYAFYWCDSLKSIVIPNSVTTIGYLAFEDCSSLTSIVIPNSVTTIGSHAFNDCTSLTIYCKIAKVKKPEGWSSNWNCDNRPVVWGYTGK